VTVLGAQPVGPNPTKDLDTLRTLT
jgi:hypothetical protein